MSHEGIRLISAEQAQRENAPEVKLPVEAVTPSKVRVMKTEGTGMEIDWRGLGIRAGGRLRGCGRLALVRLAMRRGMRMGGSRGSRRRRRCRCCRCSRNRVRPLEASAVGKYALRFKWNDGHESGIYSWEYLRRLPEGAEAR